MVILLLASLWTLAENYLDVKNLLPALLTDGYGSRILVNQRVVKPNTRIALLRAVGCLKPFALTPTLLPLVRGRVNGNVF